MTTQVWNTIYTALYFAMREIKAWLFQGQLTISVWHHISMHMSINRAQKHYVIGCVRVMVGFNKSKASRQQCMSKLAREYVCKWVSSWVTLRQWEGEGEKAVPSQASRCPSMFIEEEVGWLPDHWAKAAQLIALCICSHTHTLYFF